MVLHPRRQKGDLGTVTMAEGGSDQIYEVNRILDLRVVGEIAYYLVEWKTMSASFNSWEPKENLVNCSEALAKFELERAEGPKLDLDTTEEEVTDTEEPQVEQILKRRNNPKSGELQYQVKFKGRKETSWESSSALPAAVVQAFNRESAQRRRVKTKEG
jgi:hypothetical protein